jgi:hypothetical protein
MRTRIHLSNPNSSSLSPLRNWIVCIPIWSYRVIYNSRRAEVMGVLAPRNICCSCSSAPIMFTTTRAIIIITLGITSGLRDFHDALTSGAGFSSCSRRRSAKTEAKILTQILHLTQQQTTVLRIKLLGTIYNRVPIMVLFDLS